MLRDRGIKLQGKWKATSKGQQRLTGVEAGRDRTRGRGPFAVSQEFGLLELCGEPRKVLSLEMT